MSTLQPVVSACHEHCASQDDVRTRRTTVVIVPTSFIEEPEENRTRVIWACNRRDCHNLGCEYSTARRRQKERGYEV